MLNIAHPYKGPNLAWKTGTQSCKLGLLYVTVSYLRDHSSNLALQRDNKGWLGSQVIWNQQGRGLMVWF